MNTGYKKIKPIRTEQKEIKHIETAQTKAQWKYKRLYLFIALAIVSLTGCGKQVTEQGTTTDQITKQTTGIAYESGSDYQIDFEVLQQENPDIFGWLYIPGTEIDYPLLQSEEADDYYESHDAYGSTSDTGALYTELANLTNMCDFNTVIHGKTISGEATQADTGKNTTATGSMFTDLHLFADQDFFTAHEEAYLFLPDNLLTYEIFAAYPREDTSLIRIYDFTYMAGCEQFLKDLYDTREIGKNIRADWEELTAYHFLITLTTQMSDGRQYVVLGALVGDAAGKIDRVVVE